jgi:hypothetical protein
VIFCEWGALSKEEPPAALRATFGVLLDALIARPEYLHEADVKKVEQLHQQHDDVTKSKQLHQQDDVIQDIASQDAAKMVKQSSRYQEEVMRFTVWLKRDDITSMVRQKMRF